MRSKKILHNSIIALLQNYITLLLTFVTRTIFIKVLGSELLGVNGLFSDVFNMLSLMELGIGSAITYYLYEPIAKDNKYKITQILNLYGKLYKYIGISILIVGIAIMPMFPYIITDYGSIHNISYIYLLLLLNVFASYFFAYKRALLEADQKAYINSLNYLKFNVIRNISNIIILLLTKNYYLYLIINIVCTFISNVSISKKVDKLYPYILDNVESIDKKEEKQIFSRARALLCHKIGSVVVFGTDNLLLSTVASFSFIGKYSNYVLIINAITAPLTQIFNALTASIGNVSVLETKENAINIFKKVFFVNFWLVSFSSIALFVLINPFIQLWVGSDYTLTLYIVFILILNFYISGIRNTANYFNLAKGLFWNTRMKPLIEAILNIFLSLIFIKLLGPIGVMLGTTASSILTSVWLEPYVLYKNWFKKSVFSYFMKLFQYTLITLVLGAITFIVCENINVGNILMTFVIRMILVALIPNVCIALLFKNTDEFKYVLSTIKNLVKSKNVD